uniref:Uncharacterized protein n=1 Tax=Anopheles albimanus TaxID=7167 RepID=A0A182FX10_ANOAL
CCCCCSWIAALRAVFNAPFFGPDDVIRWKDCCRCVPGSSTIVPWGR